MADISSRSSGTRTDSAPAAFPEEGSKELSELLAKVRLDLPRRLSPKRLIHVRAVEDMAVRLGRIYLPRDEGRLRAAALLHDIGKPEVFTVDEYGCGHMKKHAAAGVKIAERIADELKFSKMLKHEVTELVLYHDSFPPADKKSVKKFVSLLGFELVQKLFVLQKADILAHSKLGLARLERLKGIVNVYEQILEEDPCMSVDRLEITGKDILDLGCPEGPEVGKILQDVLDKVMSEELSNSREEIIDYVRRVFDIK